MLHVGEVMLEMFLCCFFGQAARSRGVDCVVAPYEADAQLAFLTKSGLAQAVITEDSDLLAFGCKKVHRGHLMVVWRRMMLVAVQTGEGY